MTRRWLAVGVCLATVLWLGMNAWSAEPQARFPKPDFETGYVQPSTQCPAPRAAALEWLDVAVLAGALAVTAWLAIRQRSRPGVLAMSIFSILYFGFFRKGCICPVGSIQNVAAALSSASFVLPWTVVLIFLLPLVFALFFGRVFCAAVCPLGAIQDVVIRRPVRLPRAVAGALGLGPYLLLGVAVLYAVTGAGFVICRHDPFVGFFRLGAPMTMLVSGAALLLIGIFVARPYCRFLCPYSVLLNWMARFSARHVTITPDECVNCRLCEEACPFDCIQPTTPERPPESRPAARRRLGRALALVPVSIAVGVLAGLSMHTVLAAGHPVVRLAARISLEERGRVKDYTLESEAFRGTGQPTGQLYGEARMIVGRFRVGSMVVGGFLGIVVAGQLAGLALWSRRKEYAIDRGNCLSCGRCFEYCPVDRQQRSEGRADGN
jgi:NosR/NirI family nitrous oxide reductase transcriptional regulator